MPVVENKIEGVVSDPKERQKNAIDMVTVLINHPVMAPILFQMLIHRDNNGLTPFQTALNIKAFAAATEIWAVIKQLCFSPNAVNIRLFSSNRGFRIRRRILSRS